MPYLVFDLETEIAEAHGRKGNPLLNEIIAVGMKPYNFLMVEEWNGDGQHTGYYKFTSHINYYDVLVGHNIKFDLLYLWKKWIIQEWFEKGGQIWDTQLAEYMLSGQRHKYPALRDIAVNKYGCPEREKKMEKYWDQGICTKNIPMDIVLADVANDVLDTEQVMLQQVKQAKKEGMYHLIRKQMDALLATTEMEYNGVYINKEIFDNNRKKLENRLSEIQTDLSVLTERYWK